MLDFDKDDKYAAQFVAAATNLRTYNFSKNIPDKPKLEHWTHRQIK